jgi:hypothetical protein
MSRAETAPQTWNVVTTARATAQKTLNRAEMRAPTPPKEMRELTHAVNAKGMARVNRARRSNRRTLARHEEPGTFYLDSAMTHRELAKAGIVSHLEQQHLEITVVGI